MDRSSYYRRRAPAAAELKARARTDLEKETCKMPMFRSSGKCQTKYPHLEELEDFKPLMSDRLAVLVVFVPIFIVLVLIIHGRYS